MNPSIAYVGDDFIGSTEVMEVLYQAGLKTVLFVRLPIAEQLAQFEGYQAVGIASRARQSSPEEIQTGLRTAFELLKSLKPRFLHYKTSATGDSSPRMGSLGKAIELGREVCESSQVPVVIANPQQGRFQAFGNLFATSGDPPKLFRLDRHPVMRYHPLTPMYEADFRAHLKLQTELSIDLIDCSQLDAATTDLWSSQADIVLIDATCQRHLQVAASYMTSLAEQKTPLFVAGSEAIEIGLVANEGSLPGVEARKPSTTSSADTKAPTQLLVLSGSCSPINERQTIWARQVGFEAIDIEPAKLIDPQQHDSEADRVLDLASQTLGAGRNLILHTVLGLTDRRRNQLMNAYAAQGLEQEQVLLENSKRLGPLLGKLLSKLLAKSPVKRLALSGNDISHFVVRELGISALEAVGSVAPGVPLCRAYADNALDGLELVFKGGLVGDEHFWNAAR